MAIQNCENGSKSEKVEASVNNTPSEFGLKFSSPKLLSNVEDPFSRTMKVMLKAVPLPATRSKLYFLSNGEFGCMSNEEDGYLEIIDIEDFKSEISLGVMQSMYDQILYGKPVEADPMWDMIPALYNICRYKPYSFFNFIFIEANIALEDCPLRAETVSNRCTSLIYALVHQLAYLPDTVSYAEAKEAISIMAKEKFDWPIYFKISDEK